MNIGNLLYSSNIITQDNRVDESKNEDIFKLEAKVKGYIINN